MVIALHYSGIVYGFHIKKVFHLVKKGLKKVSPFHSTEGARVTGSLVINVLYLFCYLL